VGLAQRTPLKHTKRVTINKLPLGIQHIGHTLKNKWPDSLNQEAWSRDWARRTHLYMYKCHPLNSVVIRTYCARNNPLIS